MQVSGRVNLQCYPRIIRFWERDRTEREAVAPISKHRLWDANLPRCTNLQQAFTLAVQLPASSYINRCANHLCEYYKHRCSVIYTLKLTGLYNYASLTLFWGNSLANVADAAGERATWPTVKFSAAEEEEAEKLCNKNTHLVRKPTVQAGRPSRCSGPWLSLTRLFGADGFSGT